MASPSSDVKFATHSHLLYKLDDNLLLKSPSKSKSKQEDFLSIVSDCLVKKFEVDPSIASHTVKQIFAEQEKLSLGQAIKFVATEFLPFELVITKNKINCLSKKVGQGTFSLVFETFVIPTVRHDQENHHFSPGKPTTAALKRTKAAGLKTAFSPEKRQLAAATKGQLQGIDYYIETFRDSEGVGYSLHMLFRTDLHHFEFHKLDNPILSMLNVLTMCASGLATLHSNHFVHRDIKGANILVTVSETEDGNSDVSGLLKHEASGGALTDFGFLSQEEKSTHHTTGTVLYLDASMFGIEKESLFNQKHRKGIQTKEGDVYALGMTIYRDILVKFINGLNMTNPSAKTLHAKKLLDMLAVKKHYGPFNAAALRKHALGSHYRKVHGYEKKGSVDVEVIYEYPQLEEMRKMLKIIILNLSDCLKKREMDALVELSDLCCNMQVVDYSKRPTSGQVVIQLNSLLQNLKSPIIRNLAAEFVSAEAEEKPKSSPTKRHLEKGVEDEAEEVKSARLLEEELPLIEAMRAAQAAGVPPTIPDDLPPTLSLPPTLPWSQSSIFI